MLQHRLAILLFIIGLLVLMVASGLMVYAIGSNQQTRSFATLDDGFKQFLTSFLQAFTTNDLATVASETDQKDFGDNQQLSNALGYDWKSTYEDLQAGTLTLSIQMPILYTCQNYSNAYASYAVMGTYTISTTDIIPVNGSGYAVFVFEQPEQDASWYWVGLTLNGHQCPQST